MFRDGFIDFCKRHRDGLFLARLDDLLHIHGIDRKAMLGRQRVFHLEGYWSFEVNRAATFPDFRAVFLRRRQRDISGLSRRSHADQCNQRQDDETCSFDSLQSISHKYLPSVEIDHSDMMAKNLCKNKEGGY